MELTAAQALWLLPPVLPVALWIAWSDLKFMKITNRAALLTACVFLAFGLIALPFEIWLWRIAQMALILAIGFFANMLRLIGGGDAKYAAAMAGFFAPADLRLVVILFATMLLAAFVTHRLFGRIPALRRMTKGWKSWDAGDDFPMGLALSGTLLGYLVLAFL
jgi:prepilin peptidase CpaA